MKGSGDSGVDLLVRARSVLLDALDALWDHRDAIIVIGAQAVYLRTGGIDVALAEATKDSDVAVDPRHLASDPRLEAAMRMAGFFPSATAQPGSWVNAEGIPVDLMVPEDLAGPGSRGARIPPHDVRATRRARGLEAALVDCDEMEVTALDPHDSRVRRVRVAGAAALLVAKLHKIGERVATPGRLNDKDAHDAYRVLRAVETADLSAVFTRLLADDLSNSATREALEYLSDLFAPGPEAIGSMMAGRAEEVVGEPAQVSAAVAILSEDLLTALGLP
ncbi:hypothetical protein [Mycetocola sp. JXN-3]|uniref:hypothetical protein n=1 Tax=Mycetocola sp. JXN-3 TaxID=2116510 RepID=UPI00165CF9C6|nr:hypothetical protein [Mycetocola sp. JXN-3]